MIQVPFASWVVQIIQSVTDDTKRRRFAMRAVAAAIASFSIGFVLLSSATTHYRVGLDLAAVRCLPWRVYVVELGGQHPFARGDYVAFVSRGGLMGKYFEGRLIGKQVAGIAGDTVSVRNDVAYVNGQQIGALILNKKLGKGPGEFDRELIIPKDMYFVVGTHPRSYDSRYWGLLKQESIVGEVRPLL